MAILCSYHLALKAKFAYLLGVLMKSAIGISRITPPRLHQNIDRPHLFKRLDRNKEKKLTLILGQAAQGKSTLTASYVKNSGFPTAWVNLRKEDSDPVNLFFSTVHALQHVFDGIDLSPLLNYPAVSLGPRLEKPLYREWTAAIFDCVTGPVQIVLDGLNNLASKAPSFDFLQVMLEELPRDYHLIMLSRYMPPLNIEALKVKREAHVLINSELAFTPKEIKAFFSEMRGMAFSSDQIKHIHAVTNGWVGGLVLLSEVLDRLPEEARGRYILGEIPDQFRAEVFRYFGEEILASQAEAVKAFLIRSSMFETIEPTFMKEVVSFEDAEALLLELARRNLFTEARYVTEKGWEFQHHPLFREFLKEKFRTDIDGQERSRLFLRVGMLYEQKGELEQSVGHYLKAGAFEQAASVVEQIGMHLLGTGRNADLAQWLRLFPGKLVWENPWLLLYQSMIRRFTHLEETLDTLTRCLHLFERYRDMRGQLISLAALIMAVMVRGRDVVPLQGLLEKGEQLVNLGASMPYPHERAILLYQMGFCLTIRSDDQRKAYRVCREAYLLAQTHQDLVLQINALMYASQALTFLGEFSAAEEEFSGIDPLIRRCPYPELRAMYFINQLSLWIFRGKGEKAAKFLRQSQEEIQKHGLVYLYPFTLMYEVMLDVVLERFTDAKQAAEQLLEMGVSTDSLFLKGATLGLMGICSYRKGAYEEAGRFLEKALRIFSSTEAYSPYHLLNLKFVMGLISLHTGDMSARQKELQAVLNDCSRLTNRMFEVHALFTMALLHAKQGNIREAIPHLDAAFRIVEEQGYDYFWLINTADLLAVCVLAAEKGRPKAAACASRLLSTALAPVAGSELEKLSRHPRAGMRKQAMDIQRAIHRNQLPRIRIETFGGFKVYQDATPIPGEAWQRIQPKAILKSLITHGSRGVAKDLVVEDVWPENQLSEKNFKVALHRLRKTLEPGMNKAFGSSYIHLKENKLYLDEELIDLDVDRFLAMIQQGNRHERESRIHNALSSYQEAMDLYQGDFLPEDLYATWIEIRRKELKDHFMDLLLTTARIHEQRNSRNKAVALYKKALQTDPFMELACQRLMQLLSEQGQRNEALRVYEQFKTALDRELDARPDPLTDAICQKILA